jgi:hypothetical protein
LSVSAADAPYIAIVVAKRASSRLLIELDQLAGFGE